MGQYRQWLHYRHVDQQLQSQKEELTRALTHLWEHINHLDAHPLAANNRIVQALTLYTKTLSIPSETLLGEQLSENGKQPEIISQALFDHSRLPDCELLQEKDISETVLPKRPTNTYGPLPPIPYRAIDLVPEDSSTLPDEHTPTEPQIALPWWLHKAALSATQSNSLERTKYSHESPCTTMVRTLGTPGRADATSDECKWATTPSYTARKTTIMSVADNANTPPTTYVEHLDALFSQLDAQQVETFYKSYQHWQLEQQDAGLQEQLATLEQQIVDNHVLMQLTQPSPIALATLTRLQSYGVEDVDLLDSMLERGDTWLDHTLQLLEQCERLDVIHGNYTEWCQHALEGAYEWLDSMPENEVAQDAQAVHEQGVQAEISDDTTEALLLQKLMSEDETVKVPAIMPTSVPTDSYTIPSILSYPTTIETHSTDPVQAQEDIPVPAAPIHEIPPEVGQQKSPKHGLVARILAKVWQT